MSQLVDFLLKQWIFLWMVAWLLSLSSCSISCCFLELDRMRDVVSSLELQIAHFNSCKSFFYSHQCLRYHSSQLFQPLLRSVSTAKILFLTEFWPIDERCLSLDKHLSVANCGGQGSWGSAVVVDPSSLEAEIDVLLILVCILCLNNSWLSLDCFLKSNDPCEFLVQLPSLLFLPWCLNNWLWHLSFIWYHLTEFSGWNNCSLDTVLPFNNLANPREIASKTVYFHEI